MDLIASLLIYQPCPVCLVRLLAEYAMKIVHIKLFHLPATWEDQNFLEVNLLPQNKSLDLIRNIVHLLMRRNVSLFKSILCINYHTHSLN